MLESEEVRPCPDTSTLRSRLECAGVLSRCSTNFEVAMFGGKRRVTVREYVEKEAVWD